MNRWLVWDATLSEPAVWRLAEFGARACILFAAAALATYYLRRSSAALRHGVWLAAFAGAGALPLAAMLLPGWHWNPLASERDAIVAQQANVERVQQLAQAHPWSGESSAIASTAPMPETIFVSPPAATGQAPRTAPVAAAPIAPVAPWPWAAILLAAWLLGVAIMLIPLALGALSLALLGRKGTAATDQRLIRLFDSARRQLHCRKPVRLLMSPERQVPMTWGVSRPTVLLPASSSAWSDEQLRMVLLHELAHICRADCAAQWLAQLCRAMYWYNPLAWYALARLRVEQEQACDDHVLATGCDASDYAEHLVAVAAAFRPRRSAAALALAMADRSRIERRVIAILNGACDRRRLSRRTALACLAATATVVAVIASYSAQPLPAAELDAAKSMMVTVERTVVRQDAADQKMATDVPAPAVDSPLLELQEQLRTRYVTSPDESQLVRSAMRGMVEALGDQHSEMMTSEEFSRLENQIQGALTGIGVQLEMRDGRPTVMTPFDNSPALKAGIRPGDVILRINDEPAGEKLPEIAARIMGPADSVIKLLVQRGDGSQATFEIHRAAFKIPSVQGYLRDQAGEWDYQLDAENKIAYARVTQFGAGTAEELHAAISDMKEKIKGLVLDLRYCPGGLMGEAVEVVRLFTPTGEIVTLRGRDGSEQRIGDGNPPTEPPFPIVVLVNEYTASSAEIVAGALQANKCAIVVGSRTHGKASVQELLRLQDGSGIRLTTAYYHLPDGRNIHKRPGEKAWGVDPNDGYFVPMSAEREERFMQSLRDRERLGAVNPLQAVKPKLDDAAFQELDPQLAASWKALQKRLATGQFQPTGGTTAQLQAYVQQRELATRRGELVGQLEQVSKQLRELDSKIGAEE